MRLALFVVALLVAGCGSTKTVTRTVTTAPAPQPCTSVVRHQNHYALAAIKLGTDETKLMTYYGGGKRELRLMQDAYRELGRAWKDCQ